MQDFLVYVIVLGAVVYLARALWGAAVGNKSGCNSCGTSCAANKPSTPKATPLIQIDLNQLNGKH